MSCKAYYSIFRVSYINEKAKIFFFSNIHWPYTDAHKTSYIYLGLIITRFLIYFTYNVHINI
jgi:hypothetical protein